MKSISTPVFLPISEKNVFSVYIPTQKNQSRSVSADLLKAISIIAVVLIHCLLLLSSTSRSLELLLPTWRFCVPIFIFLWAHFAEKSISKNHHELRYLVTRLHKLFIPFLVWSTVYFFLTSHEHYGNILALLSKHYSGYGWSGQYYFIILFQLLASFFLIRRISRPLAAMPLLTAIASLLFYFILAYSPLFTISIINKVSGRLFLYWLPYVILGVIYKKDFLKLTSNYALVLALASPLLISFELHFFHPNSESYFIPSVFVSSMLLSITFLNIQLNGLLSNPVVARALSLIARNTLGIFCLNPLIILGLAYSNSHFINLNLLGQWLVLLPAYSLVIIGACLGLIFLLRKLRLGALVTS